MPPAPPSLEIRLGTLEDAPRLAVVHAGAIRALAREAYDAAVIEAWAPRQISDAWIERFRVSHAEVVRVVAVEGGRIVGFGEVVPEAGELRACYVAPEAARRGVGRALVRRLEAIARGRGVRRLWLHASLNAEPFYRALGYESLGHGVHRLSRPWGETPMACVEMAKLL